MASDIILTDDGIHLIGKATHRAETDSADTIALDPVRGNLRLGGGNADGDLSLRDGNGSTTIHLSGGGGSRVDGTKIFADGARGEVELETEAGQTSLGVSRAGKTDVLTLRNENGEVFLHAEGGRIQIFTSAGIALKAGSTMITINANGILIGGSGGRVEVSQSDIKVIGGGRTVSLSDLDERVRALEA